MSSRPRQPNGSSLSGWARAASIAVLGVALPGCPLSDEYFVETKPQHAPPPPSGMAGRAGPGDAGRAGSNTGGGGNGGAGGDRTLAGRGGAASVAALPDACEMQRYGEHAYVLCLPAGMERANHLDASMRCVSYAEAAGVADGAIMDLVVIDSAEENQFLVDWLSGATRDAGLVWIGATDIIREKTWVWGRVAGTTQFFTQDPMRGGTPFMDRYNDFADNRPDGTADDEQDCGALDSSLDWKWDDERCSEAALGFVCEEVGQ
jgi:hypothetical protein